MGEASIEVRLDRKVKGISEAWVKKVIKKTLALEKTRAKSVSVFLTGNKKIRSINKRYLKHDYATDVIAFGMDGSYLGDVVVSTEMAMQMAKELKIDFKEELARYLAHGVLHLLGYKDKNRKDSKEMMKRQETVVRAIGGNRYVSKN